MAADCAFADCNDSAVGHCHHCGRDYCRSHRYVGLHGAAALHLCTACAVTEAEAQAYSCRAREESLAMIQAIAHSLVAEGFSPPEAFIWTHRTESTWWAFGRFGRYRVAVPAKRGWLVGDYPWGGMVNHGPGASTNEVFVRPTYVDSEGQIAPRDATRSTLMDDALFTDEMCREIADTMEQIAAYTHDHSY